MNEDVTQAAWQELVEYDDRTSPEEYPDMALITFEELRDFMARAAKAMQERCAKVAQEHADQCDDTAIGRRTNQTARNVADAIRALNQEETP